MVPLQLKVARAMIMTTRERIEEVCTQFMFLVNVLAREKNVQLMGL